MSRFFLVEVFSGGGGLGPVGCIFGFLFVILFIPTMIVVIISNLLGIEINIQNTITVIALIYFIIGIVVVIIAAIKWIADGK